MVESKHVLNGLISGAVSGAVTAVVTYLTLPSVDEVMETVKQYSVPGVPEDLMRQYLSIALALSGVIAFVFTLLIGAVLGALHGWVDSKMSRFSPSISAVIVGAVMAAFFVLPNVVLQASIGKIITNSITVLTYTGCLVTLSVIKNPRS